MASVGDAAIMRHAKCNELRLSAHPCTKAPFHHRLTNPNRLIPMLRSTVHPVGRAS